MEREPNTQYIANISYGKDSMAMLEAIKLLGYPIDRIMTADVWATDDIPADLPPMVEFKNYADKEILERYGIGVEHVCAMRNGEKLTYEKLFYHFPNRKKETADGIQISGFQRVGGSCGATSQLKCSPRISNTQGGKINTVRYLGIASDELERIERHINKQGIVLPLVDIGWSESDCRKWCENNNLLSPIYQTATRGGCWFCHNQSVDQLRQLRKNYPDLWALLLKWDLDSPVPFHADGHTVHDFEQRFQWENDGFKPSGKRFRWADLDYCQMEFEMVDCDKCDKSSCKLTDTADKLK